MIKADGEQEAVLDYQKDITIFRGNLYKDPPFFCNIGNPRKNAAREACGIFFAGFPLSVKKTENILLFNIIRCHKPLQDIVLGYILPMQIIAHFPSLFHINNSVNCYSTILMSICHGIFMTIKLE